jgi:prophage tail gpP-like protein
MVFTQPEFPGAKPQEIATLVVRGFHFTDWETVWVQRRAGDAWDYFRFTAAERDTVPYTWDKLQFKPGDTCSIYLGNVLAVQGIILVRQVAYDANSHGVSLQGVSESWRAATSSIIHKDNNFPGSLKQIADELLAPTGIKADTLGTVDGTPFKPAVHPNPGEMIWTFLERIARDREVKLWGTGNTIVLIGPNPPAEGGSTIEGENILSAQVVISAEAMRDKIFATAQRQADDQTHGPQASEMRAVVEGDLPAYRPLLVPVEHPVWTQKEVQLRAEREALDSGLRIDADITVPGWFNERGKLWKPITLVYVNSDMAMLHQGLSVETVTFEQDRQAGTRTTLHLIEPGRTLTTGRGIGTAPRATTDSGVAQTPSTQPVPDPPPQFLLQE